MLSCEIALYIERILSSVHRNMMLCLGVLSTETSFFNGFHKFNIPELCFKLETWTNRPEADVSSSMIFLFYDFFI